MINPIITTIVYIKGRCHEIVDNEDTSQQHDQPHHPNQRLYKGAVHDQPHHHNHRLGHNVWSNKGAVS
jgi:hypothetical protein